MAEGRKMKRGNEPKGYNLSLDHVLTTTTAKTDLVNTIPTRKFKLKLVEKKVDGHSLSLISPSRC